MDPKLLSRLAMGVCLVLSVLLLVFFFMNWTEIGPSAKMEEKMNEQKEKAKEQAKAMGIEFEDREFEFPKASGLQLTIGTISLPDNRTEKEREQEEKNKEFHKKLEEAREKVQDEANETISVRPWFILGLLIPLAGIAIVVLNFIGKMPGMLGGVLLAVLGVLGIVLIIMAVNVDYCGDFIAEEVEKMEKNKDSQEKIDKFVKDQRESFEENMAVSGTGIAWMSFIFYILVLLGGAAVVVAPALGGKCGPCCAPKPTPPPDEPSA